MREVRIVPESFGTEGVVDARTGEVLMSGLRVGTGHTWARGHGLKVVRVRS